MSQKDRDKLEELTEEEEEASTEAKAEEITEEVEEASAKEATPNKEMARSELSSSRFTRGG